MQAAEIKQDNRRVVIEGVRPEIDSGRYPIKRVPGEKVFVEADIFTDGHEAVSAVLLYRKEGAAHWTELPMTPLVNDRWQAEFTVEEIGRYQYSILAWLDHFKFWAGNLVKRLDAGQDVSVELLIGANLVEAAVPQAQEPQKLLLKAYVDALRTVSVEAVQRALSEELAALMFHYGPRDKATTYDRELAVIVDPLKARFSAWYEFFPRSCWTPDCRQSTLRDSVERLSYVAELGFDVVYLPPVHPIGYTHRKGKNNNPVSQEGEVGSPWAIGSAEGGHKAVHPDLGTLEDLRFFVKQAESLGISVAMDIAFQCSPDHPYVTEHPEWFRHRPDGTIQYAENPPKKYEDIYPFDFDTKDWAAMWSELKSVIYFWIEQGVKIFRVDNPHTKSFRFWEWLIAHAKRDYPDTIFLAEAFTRPKVMYYLAKIGFTQSYNYFPWRNTRAELTEYLTELTRTDVREFFRANLWPNTPDILTEYLQLGGRPAFISRVALAATLGPSYGIYGPAYEMCENTPTAPGKEEYLNSEKYEIKHWNVRDPSSIAGVIARINAIRRDSPALHSNENLHFHNTANDRLIAYTKNTDDLQNIILVVVNLDPAYAQSGVVDLPLELFGIDPQQPYQVHDLLTDNRYIWTGRSNYVELNPRNLPVHIFRVHKRIRTEQDFDYYR